MDTNSDEVQLVACRMICYEFLILQFCFKSFFKFLWKAKTSYRPFLAGVVSFPLIVSNQMKINQGIPFLCPKKQNYKRKITKYSEYTRGKKLDKTLLKFLAFRSRYGGGFENSIREILNQLSTSPKWKSELPFAFWFCKNLIAFMYLYS